MILDTVIGRGHTGAKGERRRRPSRIHVHNTVLSISPTFSAAFAPSPEIKAKHFQQGSSLGHTAKLEINRCPCRRNVFSRAACL